MIDNLTLGLTHGLMLLAAFLLLRRPDLDSEATPPDPSPGRSDGRAAKDRPGMNRRSMDGWGKDRTGA